MTIDETIAFLTELKEEYETGDITVYLSADAEGNQFSPLAKSMCLMVDDDGGSVRPWDVGEDEDEDDPESDLNKDVAGICLWPV